MPTKLTITCTKCNSPISIDDALKSQLSTQIDEEYRQKYNNALKLEKEKLRLESEKATKELEVKIKEQLNNDLNKELEFLKQQNEEKTKKLDEAKEIEFEIRKQKVLLEEEKKNFELEKLKQIEAEKVKIKDEVSKSIEEEYKWRDAEKEKKLQDAIKANDELRRKLQQGSQQTQGEVLELEIEELLKNEFPFDEIVPVQKGINGADILQRIHDNFGRVCGTIAWESKHTKAWSEGWVQKLKDDQRNAKADIAVIVTTVLPKDVKTFRLRDGIWITNFESVSGLAMALRANLIQVTSTKLASVGKNEKMEVLYNYLTGVEFKQRVEVIVESFIALKNDLDKEKRAFQKIWTLREKQIQRVMENTIGMHGDLQGLIGTSLPQIKNLELDDEFEDPPLLS